MNIDVKKVLSRVVKWAIKVVEDKDIDAAVEEQIVELYESATQENTVLGAIKSVADVIDVDYDDVALVVLKYILSAIEEGTE